MKETIICGMCGEEKPRSEFVKGPASRRRRKFCAACNIIHEKDMQARYRDEHRGELRAKNRDYYKKYYAEHKDEIKAKRRADPKVREYNKAYREQKKAEKAGEK